MSNLPKCIIKSLRYIRQDSTEDKLDEIEKELLRSIRLRRNHLEKMTQTCHPRRGVQNVI